jgi:hypothetical protein
MFCSPAPWTDGCSPHPFGVMKWGGRRSGSCLRYTSARQKRLRSARSREKNSTERRVLRFMGAGEWRGLASGSNTRSAKCQRGSRYKTLSSMR